jgi:hypothetical protein
MEDDWSDRSKFRRFDRSGSIAIDFNNWQSTIGTKFQTIELMYCLCVHSRIDDIFAKLISTNLNSLTRSNCLVHIHLPQLYSNSDR